MGIFKQGSLKGNPYSTIYFGQEGRGGKGVGYGLNGRNLQYQGKDVPKCNESGTVVVRIEVNQKGDVVSAKAGVKLFRLSRLSHLCHIASTSLMLQVVICYL